MSVRFQHTIVSVNRPDLLVQALESVKPLWEFTTVLDNSTEGEISLSRKWPVPIIRPSVPLSCAQSMNYLHRAAKQNDIPIFGYQHEDAEAESGTPQKLMEFLERIQDCKENWATVFTTYDILSFYRTSAVEDIGQWDVNFPNPNYHIDVDWFHRARLKGYLLIDSGLSVKHLDGGSVTRREAWRSRVHEVTFPMNDKYYYKKWGGLPHSEQYSSAWNSL